MINLIIYVFFSLSNALIIIKINNLLILNFLQIYTLTTLLSSILILYCLSYERKLDKRILFLTTIFCIPAFFFNYDKLLWIVYAISLVSFDYLSSLENSKLSKLFRVFFSLISIMFFFEILNLNQLILVRLLIFFIFLLIFNISYKRLKIDNPIQYIIQTNLAYFGGLYLLTLIPTNNLKLLYLFQQISLGILLKIMDIKIRNFEFFKFIKNYYYEYISIIIFLFTIAIYIKLNFLLGCLIYLVSFLLIKNSYNLIKK